MEFNLTNIRTRTLNNCNNCNNKLSRFKLFIFPPTYLSYLSYLSPNTKLEFLKTKQGENSLKELEDFEE